MVVVVGSRDLGVWEVMGGEGRSQCCFVTKGFKDRIYINVGQPMGYRVICELSIHFVVSNHHLILYITCFILLTSSRTYSIVPNLCMYVCTYVPRVYDEIRLVLPPLRG